MQSPRTQRRASSCVVRGDDYRDCIQQFSGFHLRVGQTPEATLVEEQALWPQSLELPPHLPRPGGIRIKRDYFARVGLEGRAAAPTENAHRKGVPIEDRRSAAATV